MRRAITGIDHCVVLVRELDAVRSRYQRLGFTVAPRGLHPPEHGTGNHTVMLEREYLELMGVVAPTPSNEHWRRALAAREGMAALALQTPSADAAAAEMNADGVALSAPEDFARPVILPDGTKSQAAFRTTQFPPGAAPGFHLFCCEHRTRHITWLPELLRHANGAVALDHVLAASDDPRADAATVARLFAGTAEAEPDGGWSVDTGNSSIRFQTGQALAARYPGSDLTGLLPSGLVGLAVRTRSLTDAAAALARGAVAHARTPLGIVVAPREACGVLIVFTPA
jgi:catechol 2,3-dioxygenase-like lactoylglutathione lyase family enzyme